MAVTIAKGYVPGCIGRVTELHALYYSRHSGFGLPFEAKVAQEMAEFCSRYNDERDGLWLARLDERSHGSILIDGLHASQKEAHLRWFIVSDEIRGSGVGSALISAAMDFCRSKGYVRVYLWTFAGLHAARHLYEKAGFELVSQQRGAQWGVEVDEQRFEYKQP